MKVYTGHSTEYYLHKKRLDFPTGINNPPDQEAIFNMIKDLRGELSPAKHLDIAKWCMKCIKEHQREHPQIGKFYERAVGELTKEETNTKQESQNEM